MPSMGMGDDKVRQERTEQQSTSGIAVQRLWVPKFLI